MLQTEQGSFKYFCTSWQSYTHHQRPRAALPCQMIEHRDSEAACQTYSHFPQNSFSFDAEPHVFSSRPGRLLIHTHWLPVTSYLLLQTAYSYTLRALGCPLRRYSYTRASTLSTLLANGSNFQENFCALWAAAHIPLLPVWNVQMMLTWSIQHNVPELVIWVHFKAVLSDAAPSSLRYSPAGHHWQRCDVLSKYTCSNFHMLDQIEVWLFKMILLLISSCFSMSRTVASAVGVHYVGLVVNYAAVVAQSRLWK